MSEYKTVGTDNRVQNQHGNHRELGIEIEKEVLRNAEARRDTSRPAGKPFMIESPKIYRHMEADANPAPQPGSDEVRAIGKPFIQKFGQ